MPRSQANDRPLADYGMIGDMRGAALVARDGAMEWLCLDRFDADPVFLALLDAGLGGACTVTLRGGARPAGRRYRPGTTILETELQGSTGRLLVTDFMPVRGVADPGTEGADSVAPGRAVRRLRCLSGRLEVTLRLAPGFDWGRRTVDPSIHGRSAQFPGEALHVAASHTLRRDGAALLVHTVLAEGETMSIVLAHAGPLDDGDVAGVPDWLAVTQRYWQEWSGRCAYRGADAARVLRSALTLKMLTYAPTGALLAAPTAGLPEAVGGVRNWDYRYVWTRDASFSVSAFLNLGYRREAAEFLRFLHQADGQGEILRVMYGVDGPVPPPRRLDHLAGWRGSRPVLVGNAADRQIQHEIHGEVLAALNLYLSGDGTQGLCPSLLEDLPGFVRRLAETVIARWRTPDQGIWELRGPPRHLLHSKAMCWVALDRAVKLAPRLGFDVPPHWTVERDAVRADCLDHGWNARQQALTMEYGGDALDMSVLRLSLMDFLPATDWRMAATLRAVRRELGREDLFWRYRCDDGLPGQEGAFAACSFWMVGLHTLRGELAEARALLDRVLTRDNDLGLFAEEFDAGTEELVGNFPQSFTHMALIHETVRLHQAEAKAASGDP